jgi:hypothetical protein
MSFLSRLIVALTLALVAMPAVVRSQHRYDRYQWAMGLNEEFGFEDMARSLLEEMRAGDLEHRALLGLARIDAVASRRADSFEKQAELLQVAAKNMTAAVNKWPDRDSKAYFEAQFELVKVLKERGEIIALAVNDGKIPEAEKRQWEDLARQCFDDAKSRLGMIRTRFSDAERVADRVNWRMRNRAWYTECEVMHDGALLLGERARYELLAQAASSIEEFVFENDVDDLEAWVASVYGSVLLARIYHAREETEEGLAYIFAVLEQVQQLVGFSPPSEDNPRMGPFIQNAVDFAYFYLFDILTAVSKKNPKQPRWEEIVRRGEQMQERYARAELPYRSFSRAALIKIANAHRELGNKDAALNLAGIIVSDPRRDRATELANSLIAEVFAETPDKTQFAPQFVRSAAEGTWNRGPEAYGEAARYYRILLHVIEKRLALIDANVRQLESRIDSTRSARTKAELRDQQRVLREEREELATLTSDCWMRIGRAAYEKERWLQAAFAFEEGARRGDSLPPAERERFGKLWERCLKNVNREAPADFGVDELLTQCRDWLQEQGMGNVARRFFTDAETHESEARRAADKGDLDRALAEFEAAAEDYENSRKRGGSTQERAQVKVARMKQRAAKILDAQKNEEEAKKRFAAAKADFLAYLQFSEQDNLTDSRAKGIRRIARAEAKYAVGDVNDSLMNLVLAQHKAARDAEKPALQAEYDKLRKESLRILEGVEQEYPEQESLLIYSLRLRFVAELGEEAMGGGDPEAAERTYEAMKKVSAQHGLIARTAFDLARHYRGLGEDDWKRLTGRKFDPTDVDAFERVAKKDGFSETRDLLRRSNAYYREWIAVSEDKRGTLKNWAAVVYYHYVIGEWEGMTQVAGEALELLGTAGSGDGKPESKDIVNLRRRQLIGLALLARQKRIEGDEKAALAAEAKGRAQADILLGGLFQEPVPASASGAERQRLTAENLEKAREMKRQPLSLRMAAARVYGGYLFSEDGRRFSMVGGTQQYAKASQIWFVLHEQLKNRDRTKPDEVYEALYYGLITEYMAADAVGGSAGRQRKESVTRNAKGWIAASPSLRRKNTKWGRLFDDLARRRP